MKITKSPGELHHAVPHVPRRLVVAVAVVGAMTGCHQTADGTGGRETEGGGLEPTNGWVKVPPREGAAALINHWLQQGIGVELEGAHYELEVPIEVPSGGRLRGGGPELTRLEATWDDPGPAGADDPEEALIRIVGTTRESATSLAATATQGVSSLQVLDPAAIGHDAAWILVQGNNYGDDAYQMSDGTDVVLSELLPLTAIDGDRLVLVSDTAQHHRAGGTVRVVDPVVDVVVEGIFLDGGGRTLAVGIACGICFDVRLDRIGGGSLSRAIVDLRAGTREIFVEDLRSEGAVNSMMLADSAIGVQLDGLSCIPLLPRCHEHGVPRGMVSLRNRCTSISVRNGTIQNACIGLRVWGGHHVQFSNLLLRDLYCGPAVERDPEIGGGPVGVGIDSGAGPIHIAEFAFDVTFDGVRLEDCRHPDPIRQAGMYVHDILALTMSGCSIVNKGDSPHAPGNHANGLLLSDVSGQVDSIQLRGVNWPLRTSNVFSAVHFGSVDMSSGPGAGAIGIFPLSFNTTGGRQCDARIEMFSFSNFDNALALFGDGFAANPDWDLRIAQMQFQLGTFFDLVVARNVTGIPLPFGDLVELDPDSPPGTRHIRSPMGPNSGNAVAITGSPYGYGTGFMLVALLPSSRSRVRCTDGEVRVGDLLVASSVVPGAAEAASPDADPLTVFGRALAYKAAGAEGLVDVGAV